MTRNGTTITLSIGELAYIGEVNRQLGYKQAELDMAAQWSAMVKPISKVLKQPTFAELQQLRYAS
ncbi:hypothetical protein [uncultured Jatrophihabitans sp.]|uniref:hypothetical protein n=1 Tax=uncultured Jatrophihabitans sp. TaxID=1610747 RepID=UPI0035CC8CE8